MTLKTLIPLALLGLGGCGWGNMPAGNTQGTTPLWNAHDIVAAGDGLYVKLSATGRLVRVTRDGATLVDTGPGRVDQVALAPDGETVVAFARRTRCVSDDPRETRGVKTVEDCPGAFREVSTQVLVLNDADVTTTIDVSTHFNAVTFSGDGRWAVAWLDVDKGIDLTGAGVVDLTSVLVLDLDSATATPVSVGFAASNLLFTEDATRAVVLSKDSVALVDLTGERPERSTVFPLTLDADQRVTPVGVALTPDGRYALITARGSDDLYVLRLERPSINLVNLSGRPSAMAVFPDDDPSAEVDTSRTVVVHTSPVVDVMDHTAFDIDATGLDEPMDHIELAGREAILWGSEGQHDLYRIDIDTNELVEYRLENPAVQLQVAPGGDFAVALTRPEGGFGDDLQGLYDRSPGMELIDLRDARGRTAPFLLEGQGLGMAFAATDTRLDTLVLQQGQDYLYQLDLYTLQTVELDLAAPPVAIGSLPDGGFWITHDAMLGLVTFYDPSTGQTEEIAGFGALGWLEGTPLAEEEE
jgi:DNA-binding beta-propeller fold protein YncE